MFGLGFIAPRVISLFGGYAIRGWFKRLLVTAGEIFLLHEVIEVISTIMNVIWGGTLLLWADNNPKLAIKAVGFVADEITKQTPIAGQLAAVTIEQITGITIDKDKLFAAASGPDRNAYKQVMGDEFTQVVSNMLNINSARQDFETRTGFVGSFSNLSAYFGTNLDFQLRSLTIGTISSIFGWESLRHLEGLHQSINWAFGFGWLSWSVLSNAMDVTVNAGIKRYYNSQIKPHDLSQAQANKSLIRGYLSPEVWNQIHDNAGMRNDARDWQLLLEYAQPSVTQIRESFQHKGVSEFKMDELLRYHEYTPDGETIVKTAMLKDREWSLQDKVTTDLYGKVTKGWEPEHVLRDWLVQQGWSNTEIDLAVKANSSDRIYKLREAVTAEHFKFLRHGFETEQETRQWLASQGWTEEEMNLGIEANRLEQKAAKLPKARFLTPSQIVHFVGSGYYSIAQGKQYLFDLGMNVGDANDILVNGVLEHALAQIPKKIRDECLGENYEFTQLQAALNVALAVDPLAPIRNADFFKQAICIVEKYLTPQGA